LLQTLRAGTSNSLLTSNNTLTELGILYLSHPSAVDAGQDSPAHSAGAATATGPVASEAAEGSSGSNRGGGSPGNHASSASSQHSTAAGASEPIASGDSEGSGLGTGNADEQGGWIATAGSTWSELCSGCIRHLEAGHLLTALPHSQQRYCSLSCGFWPKPSPRLQPGSGMAAGITGAVVQLDSEELGTY